MTSYTKPYFMLYPNLHEFWVGARITIERFDTMTRGITNYHVRVCVIPCLVFHIAWTKYLARD